MKEAIRNALNAKFRRTFTVTVKGERAAAIDVEKRTVELAFSSEAPAHQHFGIEILDHSAGAVDLSRLSDGGHPLLWMHEMNDQIGVIESARIDSDKVGRAVVRFSKSTRGEENFVDVQDGIKTKVSVGYQILAMVLEGIDQDSGEEIYRVTKWMPYEISLVSVPADAGVGVGRSMPVTPTKPAETRKENFNMKDILALAKRFASLVRKDLNLIDEAIRFGEEGKTAAEFQAFINENLRDMSAEAGSVTVKTGGFTARADIEKAIREVAADKGSRNIRVGFGFGKRASALDASSTKGGEMVATEVRPVIEVLRPMSVLINAGAQILTGLKSNIRYPRITGAAAAAWAAKGAAAGGTAPATGSVDLSPKRLAITFTVDKQFLAQVDNVEAWLDNQLNEALAHGLDLAGLTGDGDNKPTGILETEGVAEIDFAAGGATWAKITSFLGEVALANYDFNSCTWVLGPLTMAHLMAVEKSEGSAKFIMEDGKIAGYSARVSSKVTGGKLVFGDAKQTVFAIFGDGYDLTFDPFTRASYGEVVVTAQVLADFAVLQPGAFAISSNSAISNA